MTVCERVRLQRIQRGELIGDISDLLFRDPNCFRAGELHNHFEYWQYIARDSSSPQQAQILGWIRDKASIKPFFKHFKGSFKGELFDSDEPPMKVFGEQCLLQALCVICGGNVSCTLEIWSHFAVGESGCG